MSKAKQKKTLYRQSIHSLCYYQIIDMTLESLYMEESEEIMAQRQIVLQIRKLTKVCDC